MRDIDNVRPAVSKKSRVHGGERKGVRCLGFTFSSLRRPALPGPIRMELKYSSMSLAASYVRPFGLKSCCLKSLKHTVPGSEDWQATFVDGGAVLKLPGLCCWQLRRGVVLQPCWPVDTACGACTNTYTGKQTDRHKHIHKTHSRTIRTLCT